jgi:hypothetical protein
MRRKRRLVLYLAILDKLREPGGFCTDIYYRWVTHWYEGVVVIFLL